MKYIQEWVLARAGIEHFPNNAKTPRKRKSRNISDMIDLSELTNETTMLRRPLQADVNLNTLNKRKARSTEIPSDVPGTRNPSSSSITDPIITTKSNTLNELRKYARPPRPYN